MLRHRYEAAARVYMVHLITCTLFADKSGVYIDANTCACSVALTLPVGLGVALR